MTEPQSIEDFEHLHNDSVERFENERLRLETMPTPLGLGPLDFELKETLKKILENIPKEGRVDPEDVFRAAVSSLPILDAKRYLVDNLLESLKRGEVLSETMKRYKDLGLISEGPSPADSNAPIMNLGTELQNRKGLWGRITTTIMGDGVNALKAIPKWVEIEPQVTFIGLVPVLSFSLKGKGIAIQDLFDVFRKANKSGSR